jgi:SpoVK/Ycf46/Vps4 family AAA+-type ATPase
MCGYKKEMEDLLQRVNPGLSRRFPIADAFQFEEFNNQQLESILDLKLKKEKLTLTPEARQVAMGTLRLAKMRPNFGNGGEVENLLSRAKTNFAHRFNEFTAEHRLGDICLIPEDFDPEYMRTGDAEEEVEKQFQDFVGLDAQVDKFKGYARRVVAMRKRGVDPKQYIPFSFVFKGPPGCGKTTAARKIGQVYDKMGLLPTAEVVEASVSDMTAEYIGQTVQKTRRLLESALGKVLFIDEAYRLAGDGRTDVYMKEARDELVDSMTKPQFAGKLIIILAGYDSDMMRLLAANAGLESRFRTHIQFSHLTPELCLILLKKNLEQSGVPAKLTDGDDEQIKKVFGSLVISKTWGNGRDIESMVKEIVGEAFETCEDEELVASGSLVLKIMHRWQSQEQEPGTQQFSKPNRAFTNRIF